MEKSKGTGAVEQRRNQPVRDSKNIAGGQIHHDRSTICRDVDHLRQQAKENITRYVGERLPEEYEKCLIGLNSILKEAWTISQTDNGVNSDKVKALALAKECYAMKLELLTNATVVDDAMRFVASNAVKTTNRIVVLDEEVSNDILRSEESNNKQQESIATSTNNRIF